MSFAYTQEQIEALARLAARTPSEYLNGGHVSRFVPDLNDAAAAVTAVAEAAAAAETAADEAETNAAAAAASAAKLRGTSVTSNVIQTGPRSFVTQAGKFFTPGTALKIVSAADPTTHFMAGVVTIYSGTALTVEVEIARGGGARSDWIIAVAGEIGQAGTVDIAVSSLPPGSAPTVENVGTPSDAEFQIGVPVGKPAGLAFAWSASTTNDDPGTGRLKISSASFSAATHIHLSEIDADGRPVAAMIGTWDGSTSPVKSIVKLFDPVVPTNFAIYAVTDGIDDNGGWDSVTVVHIDHGGAFADGQRLYVEVEHVGSKGDPGQPGAAATVIVAGTETLPSGSLASVANVGTSHAAQLQFAIPAGPTGARGATVAMRYLFGAATADADPGPGTIRLNSTTITSATQAFIDNVEAGGVDVTAWLDSFDDSTNATKGFLEYVGMNDPTIRGLFRVTGSVVDGSGYRKVTLTNIYALGIPAEGAPLGIAFLRAGDKGTDGFGAGTMIGPGSAVDGHIVLFDGASGDQTKDGGPLAASNIASSPTGMIAASTVQAAIAELEDEKQPRDGTLTALAGLDAVAGVVEQTGADAFTKRAIGVGASSSIPTRADGDARWLQLAGGTLTGALTLAGDASNALHPVTKQQFDAALLNLGRRSSVRVATTANITISTGLNSGDVIDGVTLANGDPVLVKNQSTAAQNGIYIVSGSPARSPEFDTYDEHAGALIAVEEGTANADTLWLSTGNRGGTLNTTAIPFTRLYFDAYTGSTTITLSANSFALNLGAENVWQAPQAFLNGGLLVQDTDASHTLALVPGSNLTANRTLTFITGDANRSISLAGNLSFAGAYAVTLTATGATNVTLPTSGTLATTAQLSDGLAGKSDTGHGHTVSDIADLGAATTSVAGLVELATASETHVGADAARAITASGLYAAAVDVASASTAAIGAADSGAVRITGTTTISNFGTAAAGVRRVGYFQGALTLTHNATSLILPGGADITTAANDRFEALSLGSGNWLVLDYTKANGEAVVSSGSASYFQEIRSLVPTNSSAVTFTSLDDDEIMIIISGVEHSVGSTTSLQLRYSTTNGSPYTSIGNFTTSGAASTPFYSAIFLGGLKSGRVPIYVPTNPFTASASFTSSIMAARIMETSPIDALQIGLSNAGNFRSGFGTIKIFARRPPP